MQVPGFPGGPGARRSGSGLVRVGVCPRSQAAAASATGSLCTLIRALAVRRLEIVHYDGSRLGAVIW